MAPSKSKKPRLSSVDDTVNDIETNVQDVEMDEKNPSDLETPVQHDTEEITKKTDAKTDTKGEEEEDDEEGKLKNVFNYRLDEGADMLNLDEDFIKLFKLKKRKVLYRGIFGNVLLMKNKDKKSLVLKVFYRACGDRIFSLVCAEASALRDLDHPNIIKPYLAVAWPGFFGICLPYYPGGDLLARSKTMSFCDVLRCFSQVTEAVLYLHTHGIVHGDLKVENVVLNKHNQAILLDFGHAQAVGANNMVDNWLGTLGCVAPEKFLGRPMCAYKMDMWSLGVILWDLFTLPDPYLSKLKLHALFVAYRKLKVVKMPYRYILERLLELNPTNRASAQDVKEMVNALPPLCPHLECLHGIGRPITSRRFG